MLFLTYYELNENMPVEERGQIAQKLLSSGLFPPKGVNIIRWDATPDVWGIVLMEAESAADVFKAISLWRIVGPGFFKLTRTAPALTHQESFGIQVEMMKNLA